MRWAALLLVGCGRIAFDAVPVRDAGTDATAAMHCGGPLAIPDNFDDGVTDPTWNSFVDDPSMTVSETGGELAITLASTGKFYAGYVQQRMTDLRGSRMFVEVPRVPDPAGIGEAAMALRLDLMNDVALGASNGMLHASTRIAGTDTGVNMIPYDPVAHRWWQIREDAGTVYFETSPDGIAFTSFATTPTPSFAANVEIQLYGGTYQAQAAPGDVHFDNLNGGGIALERWCKASSFRDGFDAGAIGPEWARSYLSGNCTLTETGGRGVVNLTAPATNNCAFGTGPDFDLIGDGVFVSVKSTPNPATDAFSFLDVLVDHGNEVFEVEQHMTDVICYEYIGASQIERCREPYVPTQNSFWRVREQGGSIIWEVGADGVAWTQMASVPEPYNFAAIKVELGAGTNGATSSPGGVSFDAYNE